MATLDHFEFDPAAPDASAAMWQLLVGHDTENGIESAHQISVIFDGIPLGERVLEIGAGVGRLMSRVGGRFHEIHGVDSSIAMTIVGKRYLLDVPNASLVLNDGIHLPYADGYFDFVYSYTCFQHMQSLAIVHRNLTEAYRVLRTGGIARIQTVASGDRNPCDTDLFDGRVFRDGEEFWKEFAAVGFERVDVAEYLTHPEHIWATARK